MSFGNMKTLIDARGETIRQSKITDARRVMRNQFEKDPSFKNNYLLYCADLDLEELISVPIKTFNEKATSANGLQMEFNALFDSPIKIGDTLFDNEKGIYWICTESFDRDGILYSGKLTRCNNMLKWQNEGGEIFEYPIFDINSTQYNSGVTSSTVMTLGSSQHMVTVTADKNTIALDHDKRFFLDRNVKNPTVFKLTQNDTTAYDYDKGLVKITLTEDRYNSETDSIEHWICDYFTPEKSDIEIIGKRTLRVGGARSFTAKTESDITWEIVSCNFDEKYLTLVPEESGVTVWCAYSEELLDGKQFTLKCVDSSGLSAEINIELTGGV